MPADSHEPATSGPRYRATTGGHGNAEPHDEPRRVWTAADVAEFNARQRLARAAYDTENHCACGNPRAFHINRVPVRCDECRKEKP